MLYKSLLFHIVFGTKGHLPLINDDIRHELHRHMGGIVRQLGGVALEIGGVADDVHLLTLLKLQQRLTRRARNLF
jgi:hypothetical protein